MGKHGAIKRADGLMFRVPFFTIFMDPLYQRLYQSERWELCREGPAADDPYSKWEYGLSTSGIGSLHFDLAPGRYTATVCVTFRTVDETLSRSEGRLLLHMVRQAAKHVHESEDQLLSRRPTEADRLVRVPTNEAAARLMWECGCDGTVEDVLII
jgi:hypothetical protein